MGAIRRRGGVPSSVEYLYQSHTVGREATCQLVIDRPAISAHHATIRWRDGAWTLRDLGSRNGTFLNGIRLLGPVSSPSQDRAGRGSDSSVVLREGDLINFAESDEVWELFDASEPGPLLVPLDGGSFPISLDGSDVLALPEGDEPQLIFYRRQGVWQLERDGHCSPLADGHEVFVDERGYRLFVTESLPATSDTETHPVERRVADVVLQIGVARDEESASLRVQLGPELHEHPPRAYLYLLAFLARRRIEQAPSRGPDAGWVALEVVCKELRLRSPEALGLLVHRCRKAIKSCNIDDPAAIIDRARRGQLRIGVPPEHLWVTRLD